MFVDVNRNDLKSGCLDKDKCFPFNGKGSCQSLFDSIFTRNVVRVTRTFAIEGQTLYSTDHSNHLKGKNGEIAQRKYSSWYIISN